MPSEEVVPNAGDLLFLLLMLLLLRLAFYNFSLSKALCTSLTDSLAGVEFQSFKLVSKSVKNSKRSGRSCHLKLNQTPSVAVNLENHVHLHVRVNSVPNTTVLQQLAFDCPLRPRFSPSIKNDTRVPPAVVSQSRACVHVAL